VHEYGADSQDKKTYPLTLLCSFGPTKEFMKRADGSLTTLGRNGFLKK
jgi:hypothetical protein